MLIFKPRFNFFFFLLIGSILQAGLFFIGAPLSKKQDLTLTQAPSREAIVSVDLTPPAPGRAAMLEQAMPSTLKNIETTNRATPVAEAVISGAKLGGSLSPMYPRISREKGEEGTALVHFTVLKNGTVADAKIVGSSGYQRLDQAALEAVSAAHFTPASDGQQAIDTESELKIRFQLQSH